MEPQHLAPITSEVCEACGVRNASICRALSPADLEGLSGCGSITRYSEGQELLNEGSVAEHVFNITEGTAMMSRLLTDGRRQILGFFAKGDFIGLTAGADYGFTVEALTPVTVCRFPLKPFRRTLVEKPWLEAELLGRASDELVNARRHVTLLGKKTAIERVTSFIIDMADRQTHLGGSTDLAHLPMTRSQIGDYLGLTLETVSRTFSVLRQRRLIQLLPHSIVRLVDREEMTRLAEMD